MKSAIGFALVSCAGASFSAQYLRSMDSEATIRQFELNFEGKHNCEPGFTGADCSQRKCPYSPNFATSNSQSADWLYTPSNAQPWHEVASNVDLEAVTVTQRSTFENQHTYRECGGRGLCDRSTGECKCFGSFTGEGCRRTTCPNDCSGHGQCLTDNTAFFRAGTDMNFNLWGDVLPTFAEVAGADTMGNLWQSSKFQQCVCDRGYEGFDCSLRKCPLGDDPETSCDDQLGADIQQVTCTKSGSDPDAFFFLSFDDQLGGHYKTRPIKFTFDGDNEANAESIQDALESLPNFAIPTVEVDVSGLDFDVTFVDPFNTGQQSLLKFFNSNDCESGQQPKLGENNTLTCTVTRDILTIKDYKEQVECSNRGSCDRDTGICGCFSGYYGLACDQVTTYI